MECCHGYVDTGRPRYRGGAQLLAQLDQGGLPIVAAFWRYPTGESDWRFVIASPLVDAEGSLPVYERIQAALEQLPGVRISLREIFAVGEQEPIVRHLRQSMLANLAPDQVDATVSRGEAASPYLPPAATEGCVYCFDPESPCLRAALLPHPRPDSLPTGPLLADLAFLHQLLRRQYAGYPDWLRQRGFDPDLFFARWMDTVRVAGSVIGFQAGIVEPLVALQQVVPDHHLLIRGAGPALDADPRLICCEYQAVIAADAPVPAADALVGIPEARPATLRVAPLLRADGRIATVLTISASGGASALTLRQDGREIVLRPRPRPPVPAPPDLPPYEHRAIGDVTVITLRSFATATAVRQQLRRLADDYPEHARRPTLLIDLRGNQGGSLEYLRAWIAQARRGEWRSHPYLEVVGALWPCGPWNLAVERQIREGTVDTPEARAERERLCTAWSGLPPTQPSPLGLGLQRGRATHPYGGRVVVLLDRHAGSSGELAALDLRRALGAMLVGERSAGTMQYGEVRRFVLPETGLVCQVPTRRFFFDTAVEGVGVPVDVYLERSEQDVTDLIPSLDRLWAAGRAGDNDVGMS